MKGVIFVISVALLGIGTISCGQSSIKETNRIENTQSENAYSMEEDIMEEILRNLVEKNYSCITELFYYGNLPYEDVIQQDGVRIAKAKSEKYKSVDDIKRFLEQVYIQEEVDRLLVEYINQQPLYFEQDSELFMYVDQTTSAGIPIPWKAFEIEIKTINDSICKFEAVVEYHSDIYEGDKERYEFQATNKDGWRLNSVVTGAMFK